MAKAPRELVVKKPLGRPKKKLNEVDIIELAKVDCSVAEIAATLGCSRDLIYTRYSDALQKGRELGNKALKSRMFALAMQGNVQLLIWLSKVRFGWHEEVSQAQQTIINVQVKEVP